MMVVVMGTGSIGLQHLQALGKVSGVIPVAIPIRPGRHEELRAKGYKVMVDLDEASRRGVKLAVIATDTKRHVEDSLAALEHGMDILAEKPLAVDTAGARQVCEQASRLNRRVFVGCVLRFSESLDVFRSLLPQIGQPHSVRAECLSYLPDWRPDRPYRQAYSARLEEGGVLRDLIHEIDYVGWIFGWPAALQARVRNLGRLRIEADEAADLLWEADNGCVVSISIDYLSRPTRRRMLAAGEHGTLEWDFVARKVTLSLAGEKEQVFISTQAREELFLAENQAFIQAYRGDPDSRLATCKDGMSALAVCDAARRASRTRREEEVECL